MTGEKSLRTSGTKAIVMALTLWAGIAGFPSAEANAAERLELPAHARDQIESLIAEKAARSPSERKVDSQLLYALRQQRRQRVAAGVNQLETAVRPKADGRVLVDLRAEVTKELLSFVEAGGGTIVSQHPRFESIRALVPFTLVDALSSRAEVRNIRPADEARTNVGPITSQGDSTHQAAVARNSLVVDGSGVKVGVLSDSVDFLAGSQTAGELPPVTVLPGRAGFGSGEGTAMLEIVHDIAPGADLYFSTAFQGIAAFAQSILDLHAAGCRVIVDDITYFAESPFQDGPIARAVNEVSAAGTLYFSSAGNSGNFSDGTSSTWEGDFRDGGPATFGRGGRLHDFGGSTFNTLNFGSSPRVDLFWADPLGGSTNDYDVYLVAANGNVIASSSNVQDGNDDPYEAISSTISGANIVIVKYSGADRYLHLSGGRSPLTYNTPGATRGHNASGASNAFCVAATWVKSPAVPFTGGLANPVETFSSDGPRRMFFQPDGTPITPGNFSATGGVSLQKPDVTAADGVATSVPGFESFFGTSAAAPHAAAIAALLLSYNPAMSPAEVRLAMESTALDIEALGVDRDSGAGIVMALAALQAPAVPVPRLVFDSSSLADGNGNGTLDINECGEVFVVLRNLISPLGETATNIVAELRSATPGVIVDPSPRFFPDIPAAGTGVNPLPFRISTEAGFSCSAPASFSLRVTAANAGEFNLQFQVASSPSPPGVAQSFPSTNAPLPIPDLGIVESTVLVTNLSQQLEQIRVALHLTHSFDSDLTISLTGPDGTSVELTSNNGGGGANYGASCDDRTTFDDNAPQPITGGLAPFNGAFRPEQPLAIFAGKPPSAVNGPWTLRIRDLAAEDAGGLQCWSLETTTVSCLSGTGACLVAPTIATHPSDITITNGGPAQFAVLAVGTEPLSYQWYLNGTNLLDGATNAVLAFENAIGDQAGVYSAIVSNPYGDAVSSPAVLTLVFTPQIVQQPLDVLATNGTSAQFTVAASGTGPIGYQWFFNATNLLIDATNATLTLTAISPATAGSYSVVVGNPYGSAASASATLIVAVPPFIVQQPLSLTVMEGDTATFSVTAGGSEPLSYHWYFNESTLLADITGPTLELDQVAPENVGGYSVIVSNAYGSVTTVEAELSVLEINLSPVVSITQPGDGAVLALDSGPIPLEATASDPDGTIASVEIIANDTTISRQLSPPYRFDWADAPAGVSAILAIATDNQGARATSAVAVINVEIASGISRLVPAGSVWNYFDQGIAPSATWRDQDFDDSSWSSGPAQLGYGDSDEATLVSFGPSATEKYITTYFRRTFVLTDSVSFTNLELRLLRDDGAIVHLNGVEIARDNLPAGEISFDTQALSSVGGIAEQTFVTNSVNPGLLLAGTNVITVEVHQSSPGSSDLSFDLELLGQRSFAPKILAHPSDQTVPEGSPVVFSANATGAKPFSHRWVFNLTNDIPDATNLTLTLVAATPENAGTYTLISSNAFGVTASSNALLTVIEFNGPPSVTLNSPTNGAVFPLNDGAILLSATATDSDGTVERVEFYRDGALLSAVHSPPFQLEWIDAPPGLQSIVAVAIDAEGGSSTSAVAHITVEFTTNSARLVSTGAVWKYFDAGLDLGTAWRTSAFDDTAWVAGAAQLGYGDGDEATVVSFGPSATDKFTTTYFRRSFLLTDAATFTNAIIRLLRDDGAAVYLNDIEIFRSNLPAGEIGFDTFASSVVSGAAESVPLDAPIDSSLLRNGTNWIAVEIHQSDAGSSDISFDLELIAERMMAPVILEQPASLSLNRNGTATFRVAAFGTPPLNYQWFFNDTNALPAATNSVLEIETVQLAAAGTYRVAVSNPLGSVVSETAVLTVIDTNQPPAVALIAPAANSTFPADAAPIQIEAAATDPDGTVQQVEFFARGFSLGIDTTPPYRAVWLDAPLGTHELWAVAIDDQGAARTSAVASVTVRFATNTAQLVSTGAVWKYLDTGSSQGTAWRSLSFDDSNWASGPAELGYGDSGDGRPEATVVSFGPNAGSKHITTYFRREFILTTPSSFTSLQLRLLRDDGAVVYLNDVEVFRSNLPAGDILFSTLASTAIGGTNESQFITGAIDPLLLRAGTNVIAVEIHQNSASSSDLSFDLALLGQRAFPPVIIEDPVDVTAYPGTIASFTALAEGSTPLNYQWHFNGSPLPGETSPTLQLSAVTVADEGAYALTVSNAFGIATTRTAFLTINLSNQAPAVAITSPASGSVFQLNAVAIPISASASDLEGPIASVSFYANGILLGTQDVPPFTVEWLDAPIGSHALQAVARDLQGGSSTSQVVTITVDFAPGTARLISAGSVWRYLDTGVDQGTNWTSVTFNDSAWARGPAELGYGDTAVGRPEATVVSFGTNASSKHPTTYFRRPFLLTDAGAFTNVAVRLLRDDGAVVYLNGAEVFRSNMPTGSISFGTFAAGTVPAADETNYFVSLLPHPILRNGTNVIAVEIHQANATSSDLSFDLELIAERGAPPFIVTPPASVTVSNGGTAVFSVVGNGTTPITYQWYRDETNLISGATNSILIIQPDRKSVV